MVLTILLILAILMQIVTGIISFRLISRTKFNSAWILFTTAQVILIIQMISQVIYVSEHNQAATKDIVLWGTLVLSLCLSVGIFLIPKILNYIDTINKQRQLTEKRILNTIIYTEENERQRFAKDIHDGLGPLLSSAKMSITSLALIDQEGSHKEIINNAAYVIDEAIKEVREISNNLSPNVLKNFGLSRAIHNFINRLSTLGDPKISYATTLHKQRLDSDIETILYRVACEGINNAIKHAQASEICVSLDQKERDIVLTVRDNGIGFDIDAALSRGKDLELTWNEEASVYSGMGLSNILSRVESIGGEVYIESEEESHTEITVIIHNALKTEKEHE